MKALRFAISLFAMTIAMIAMAEPSYRLQAPRQVVEGRKFTITFRITNGSANPPQAPQLQNCQLIFGPSKSTMSSTQIINGQVSSSTSIDYTFTYLAEKAGTTTVPETSVNVDGKKLTSSAATITILPPDKNSPAPAPGGNYGGNYEPAAPVKEISAEDMFVRVSLSKSQVYEQEAVIATVKVYTLLDISSFRATVLPTFEGFLSEELDVPQGVEKEHLNGHNYTTAILKRCILFPQKSGKLSINSGRYEVTLVQYELVSNGFFQTRRPVERQVVTQSNSASVQVLPLPEPKPASFSGAVGSFTASVAMSPLQLRTNETATYTYKISGTGNIKYLKTPTLDVPAGIDVFTPKTDIKANFTGGNITGTYQVDYTLVPQEPGSFEIPPMEFSYFNPQTKTYTTIPLDGFNIKVAQGASTSVATEQNSIAKGMTDILHIKRADKSKQTKNPSYVFNTTLYWLLYALMIVALASIILIYRRQLKLNADVKGRKLARANRVANKRLKAARSFMAARKPEEFYAELNRAIWGYISDKLGIPSSQLVRDNIASQLSEYGSTDEAVADVISVLDECEMARFTPNHSDSEMQELYNKAEKAIKSIEDAKSKQK